MRQINFVLHVGKVKTATTSFQRYCADCSSIYFFGKYLAKSNSEEEFKAGLHDVHKQLIPTFREESNFLRQHPARNIFNLINNYAAIIASEIIDNQDVNTFVLSDECISDFGNYHGDYNSILMIQVVNQVASLLGAKVQMNRIFSMGIRRQTQIIYSYYSYNGWSYNEFINQINLSISNPKNGFMSGLFFYSEIKFLSRFMSKNWSINVVPCEILLEDNQPEIYFSGLLGHGGFESSLTSIHENKFRSNYDEYVFRGVPFFGRLVFNLSIAKKNSGAISGKVINFIEIIFKAIIFIVRPIYVFRTKLDPLIDKRIHELYLKDNEMLVEFVSSDVLRKYSYVPR